MANKQDEPMDLDTNIPLGRKPPDRSPATRERSASPRARANSPSRRRDPHGWTYNHMLGILQHASDCTICGAYVTHFMESHLMENASFIDAVHCQDSKFVSFVMYRDTVSDKERAQEDTAHYRTSSDKFEAEVDDLRQHVFELEDEIKMAKKGLEKAHGPSYSEVHYAPSLGHNTCKVGSNRSTGGHNDSCVHCSFNRELGNGGPSTAAPH